mmetsp:Transcript_21919/g.75892  ORF Transcript_21919/g.75892 Transcript_21919/m.75892 type:complete len:287 (-) Transcript_21919:131-991(-)
MRASLRWLAAAALHSACALEFDRPLPARPDVGAPCRRRAVGRAALGQLAGLAAWRACPARAADTPAESIRKAAAVLPGLGPPDVLYPANFKGRWHARRETLPATFPQGEAAVSASAQQFAAAGVTEYDVRFVAYGDGVHFVADRAFEAAQRAVDVANVMWDPSNPNVLTVESRGRLSERKVTKRSFEAPSPTAFGSSEYSRIAVVDNGGVPQILAQRTQARWRWDGDGALEALEICSTFDPMARAASHRKRGQSQSRDQGTSRRRGRRTVRGGRRAMKECRRPQHL